MLRHSGMLACFPTRKIWDRYKESARSSAGRGHYGACTDCLPEYKAKMLAENKCAHPGIQFRHDEDGFIEGYLPADLMIAKAERIVGAAQLGQVSVYAAKYFVKGEERKTIRIIREGQECKLPLRELVGVYGPASMATDIAEDLRAAA